MFWFLAGVVVGFWLNRWLKRRLKRVLRRQNLQDRIKSISEDIRSAISESREAIRNNGR